MINSIKLFLKGIRVKNIIIAIACCIIAFSKLDFINYNDMMVITIIVVLLMIIANLANDIHDIQIDSINKPGRPLVVNSSMQNLFKWTIVSCSIFAVGLSFFINIKGQLIVIFSIPILILYTKLFKPLPLIGNIVVAFYLSLVFLFIEITLQGFIDVMIFPAIFAFGISLIREVIKDIEDFKGDKKSGLQTLPIYFGIKKAIYINCLIITVFIIQCILMSFQFKIYCIISLILLVLFPLFYLIFSLIKNPSISTCKKGSSLLKKITIAGLLIIYII